MGLLREFAAGLRPVRKADFVRPTRYEILWITIASLLTSFLFWSIALLDSARGNGTPTVLAVCLESLLDCLSTALVLYRFASSDALTLTPRNQLLECRTSVFCSLTMMALAAILIAFAVVELAAGVMDGPRELTVEVILSLPSSFAYLVVGMLQLHMASALVLRSLRQDAMMSILGAVVSLGTLFAALVNILVRVEDDEEERLAALAAAFPGLGGAAAAIPGPATVRAPTPLAGGRRIYRYWWLDEVSTIITAGIMLGYGAYSLTEETRTGVRWWRRAFWVSTLPASSWSVAGCTGKGATDEEEATGAHCIGKGTSRASEAASDSKLSAASREAPNEQTPLVRNGSQESIHPDSPPRGKRIL